MSSAVSACGVQNQQVSPVASTVRRSSQPASASSTASGCDDLALAFAGQQPYVDEGLLLGFGEFSQAFSSGNGEGDGFKEERENRRPTAVELPYGRSASDAMPGLEQAQRRSP